MMARTALRKWIIRALEDMEEATSQEITDWVQTRYKWGATTPQVSNLLTRLPDFEKVGFIDERMPAKDRVGGFYRLRGCVWRLSHD
jgi:hypothetical protein